MLSVASREGLAAVLLGGLRVEGVGVRGDLAEEAEDPGLVAALLLPVREVEGVPGNRSRVVRVAGQEVRLPEVGVEERVVSPAGRVRVGQGFLHEGDALDNAYA